MTMNFSIEDENAVYGSLLAGLHFLALNNSTNTTIINNCNQLMKDIYSQIPLNKEFEIDNYVRWTVT